MKVLLPHGWDAPVGYANGIAAGSGTLVFVAGQVGWDASRRSLPQRSRRSSSRRSETCSRSSPRRAAGPSISAG